MKNGTTQFGVRSVKCNLSPVKKPMPNKQFRLGYLGTFINAQRILGDSVITLIFVTMIPTPRMIVSCQ